MAIAPCLAYQTKPGIIFSISPSARTCFDSFTTRSCRVNYYKTSWLRSHRVSSMFRCRTTKFRNLVSLRSRRPAFTRPAFPSKPLRLLLPVLPPLLSQEKVPPRAQGGSAIALTCASSPHRQRFFFTRRRPRLPRRSATRTIFRLRTSKHCTLWTQLHKVCYTPGRTIFWRHKSQNRPMWTRLRYMYQS